LITINEPVGLLPILFCRRGADIVLLQQDLDVVRAGVEDGRRTFVNTGKYISITTSANFGNMVSMALATPFLPFLPLAAADITQQLSQRHSRNLDFE
jgi:magnesium-transporting ATPase (P-type)